MTSRSGVSFWSFFSLKLETMLRRIALLPAVRAPVARCFSSEVGGGVGKVREREAALENQYFTKQEQEKLKKIRDQLSSGSPAAAPQAERSYSAPAQADDDVSFATFTTFRKEILQRIRSLEDEIHNLKYSK
eukprot:TRINITY_DN14570_c0_g1_i1.p2 TRINITY_DN14570_c0_g1~~TRINITY_DN14570_c0_g1_i1.p2  ORF type:complete len:132 (-),score=36.52 TRINITY_DN14570_c0_g1_i1:476-871(-)